jgi:hypothetical protein
MPFSENIDKFSEDFKNIILLIKNIYVERELIKEKLAKFKIQYNDMVKNNNKKIFLFCLNSFFYQYKIYSAELEQIESSRKLVNNHMYSEYYKLYGIIIAYLGEINLSYESKSSLLKQYPLYKDLEVSIEYDLNDIENIYTNIILLINHLQEKMLKNITEIDEYNNENTFGFTIYNFINTLKNENLNLQGQIDLFMNYISFFLNSQKTQYDRIYNRMKDLFKEINYEKPPLLSEGFRGTSSSVKPRSSLDVMRADDLRSCDASPKIVDDDNRTISTDNLGFAPPQAALQNLLPKVSQLIPLSVDNNLTESTDDISIKNSPRLEIEFE